MADGSELVWCNYGGQAWRRVDPAVCEWHLEEPGPDDVGLLRNRPDPVCVQCRKDRVSQ